MNQRHEAQLAHLLKQRAHQLVVDGHRGAFLLARESGETVNIGIPDAGGLVIATDHYTARAYAAMVNGGIWRPATVRKLSANQIPASSVRNGDRV